MDLAIEMQRKTTLYEYLMTTGLLIGVLERLNLKEFVKFDSCNTNRTLRPQFLEKLQQMTPNMFQNVGLNKEILDWIIEKQLKIEEILIDDWYEPYDGWFNKFKLPYLKNINLKYCNNITDSGIIKIAKGSPLLQNINLYWCTQLTNEGIIELSKECRLLNRIELGECNKITDSGIIEFSKNVPLLQDIRLTECNITDSSIIEISKNCPLLKKIRLSKCINITDNSIIELSKRCPLLRNIDIAQCNNITELSVIELSNRCLSLKRINLWGCISIPRDYVDEFRKKYPLLKVNR